ncbi:MAG: hypothetical protein QM650_09415 [Microlunatus sp.]
MQALLGWEPSAFGIGGIFAGAALVLLQRGLVSRGYEGPAPVFGPEWRALFAHSL